MAEKHVCPICGKPTSQYMGHYRNDGLCRAHAQALKAGEIEFCEDCQSWHKINEKCKCKLSKQIDKYTQKEFSKHPDKKSVNIPNFLNPWKSEKAPESIDVERQRQEDGLCIVCGEDAPKGPLCQDCYYEMLEYQDEFDKNARPFEFDDHYFNLRSRIYNMKTFEHIEENCLRLMALAVLSKALHGKTNLADRVVNDIKDIIKKKSPVKEIAETQYSKDLDSKNEKMIRTSDGHAVKSQGECLIDDLLYECRIVHCYGKKVTVGDGEHTIETDWFIPVRSIREGIYIEYWGMRTKDYLKNKERKREEYKKNNIPLVEIEKDDINDKQGLTDRLLREINKLAKEYYNTDLKL